MKQILIQLEVDGIVNSINGEQYNHEGLKAGSTHSYRVRSKNANGVSDWSSVVTAKTSEAPEVVEKPTAPQNLVAKAKDSRNL